MKNTIYLLIIALSSCTSNSNVKQDVNNTFEKDLEKYENIWTQFLSGDTTVINETNFHQDVVVVTSNGNLVGIDAIKDFYMNYLNGFDNIEFTIIDAFGQGDRIVKHWNFKGTHTGNFFGIPATGNKLNLSGTTLVTMTESKVKKEQDFFDMQSLVDQLKKPHTDGVVIDDYMGI
tara:strand:+ start:488 stop:1012 length:525 start_codon:yes stop_codon:yes gene_type:complete